MRRCELCSRTARIVIWQTMLQPLVVITVDSEEVEFIEYREKIAKTEDVGDYSDHMGLGVKCSKDVDTAIRVCVLLFKISIIPVSFVYEIIKPKHCPPR